MALTTPIRVRRLPTLLLGTALLAACAGPGPVRTPSGPVPGHALERDGRFGTFLALVRAAGLEEALLGADEVTLFVPTDAAFAAWSAEARAALAEPERTADLSALLLFHAAPGRVTLARMGAEPRFASLEGSNLAVRWQGDERYTVDVARLVEVDLEIGGRLVHVLDEPLVPPGSPLAELLALEFEGPRAYQIDRDHSSVLFRVLHMGVGATWGSFRAFEGRLDVDPADPSACSIEMSVETASLDTGNASRDAYLLTEDFFDASRHPRLTFRSTSVTALERDRLRVVGVLGLRGVEREVAFEARALGRGRFGTDWYKVGYEAELVIRRSEFGMGYGIPDVAADEVRLVIALEGGRPYP